MRCPGIPCLSDQSLHMSRRQLVKATPLRGTASGAPRAGLWPWEAPPGTPAPSLPGSATDLTRLSFVQSGPRGFSCVHRCPDRGPHHGTRRLDYRTSGLACCQRPGAATLDLMTRVRALYARFRDLVHEAPASA